MTWDQLLDRWSLIDVDLHERYGIDITACWDDRPWRWLMPRIVGLLSVQSRLARSLAPSNSTTGGGRGARPR